MEYSRHFPVEMAGQLMQRAAFYDISIFPDVLFDVSSQLRQLVRIGERRCIMHRYIFLR